MTISHGVQPPSESMPARLSVGDRLRFQREQLGWSLPEVADWLRIKLVYLQALEDGRPQDLPGRTYALGFLRNYASSLGMDAQELSQHFRQEATGLERRPDLHFPAPMPERGVPAGAAVLVGVVLMAFAYAGWYMHAGHEKLPLQSVPPLPASMVPYAGGSAPAAPAPKVAAAPAPAPASAPAATVVLPSQVPPSPPPVQADVPAQAITPVQVAPAQVGVNAQVSVNASSSSWVQVRQDGGPVIYEHILQAGESWSVPPGSGKLLLSIGNAGGVTLTAGTLTTPPLGPSGAVRRNLPLDPDAVRDDIERIGTGMNQPGYLNQSGQSPPFLAGSGRDAKPPARQDGQDDQDGGQSNPEH